VRSLSSRRFCSCALLATALSMSAPASAQQNDPTLEWRTLESEHFRVHYHQGLREAAQRVANVGEAVFNRLGDYMGRRPVQVTEVVLTDITDDANGLASSIPYNRMILYVTAPEDLSTLSDFDDWLQTLVTHEFTHVAHADNIGGLPAIINAVFGKIYPPNLVQPRWLLEGIATYYESRLTSGGRLHSTVWDMYLRADALENNFVTIDQLSTGPNRWPHGTLWYLYGSTFVGYVVDRFGRDSFARLATDYGAQVIPYGVNRSLQRATGRTWEELFPEYLAHTRAHYLAEKAAIEARGRIEGERITFQGEEVAYPRFLDDRTVVFQSSDGHSHAMFRAIDVSAGRPSPVDQAWIGLASGWAPSPDRTRFVRADAGFFRGLYAYRDLFFGSIERDARGRLARVGEATQLTHGARTLYPDWSPDGDHIAYSVNHRGTQQLWEYSLAERRARPLVTPRRFEQVYTPRYSPDGAHIAISHWQRGGYRDIRVLDRQTGQLRDVTHNRAVDMHPVFSPDGRYVVYSSDRTGVANLYAYELATGRTRQITNVVNGAYMPDLSPDGRWIVYVGYTHRGYDLFRLRWDPSRWIEPGPEAERHDHRVATTDVPTHDRPYTPWNTVRPRSWFAEVSDDGFGPTAAITTLGEDVLGRHSWALRAGVGFVGWNPFFDLSYAYRGLRPTITARVGRSVTRATIALGDSEIAYPVERWVADVGASLSFPALFQSSALAIGYTFSYAQPVGPVPGVTELDPAEIPPPLPRRGADGRIRASFSFSRTQRYTYDISAHEGYEGSVSTHVADRALGAQTGSFDVSAAFAAYIPMPFRLARYHHVLALRAAGGVGTLSRGEASFFSVGGYPMFDPVTFVTSLPSLAYSSSTPLRGYAPQARVGSAFYQANVEYRFPIVQVDRGVTTLPVYFARLWGGVFFDVGDAWFGRMQPQNIAMGAGAELFADIVWGYFITTTLRVGFGQGLVGKDAMSQVYGLLGTPF
jgi:hypothetical protein